MEVDVDMMEEDEDVEVGLLPEVWLHILSFLPPADLGNVALVARGLGELATLPRLWSAAVIKKIRFRSFQLQQFFAVRRFNHISSLDFSRIQLGEESVRQLLHWSLTSHLESLDLTGLNLSQVPSDLLSPALHRLRKAFLGFTKLTADQTVHFFTHCHDNLRPRSEELCLKAINLSPVPATILAPVLARLTTANLSFTELTVEQVTLLLGLVVRRGGESRLANLDLFSVDLSAVCPVLLAQAVASLTVASLSNTEMRLEQAHAICDHVLKSNTLRDLNIDFAELFSVPAETVGSAMTRLEKVSLACTVLGEEQVLALATAMAQPTSKIRHLDLLDLQLSSLSPTLLVSAAVRLSKVNLSGSKLTREQVDCLMEGLDLTVMRDLNLDYVLLSSCAPETLATVVASLHTASLKKCGLTETQVSHLLTALVHQPTSLTALCLHGNSLATADPNTLAAAAISLNSLDVSNCLLTKDTATSLFMALPSVNCKLKMLTMLGNRLGEVEAEALQAAVSSLERLDLSSTALTAEQLEAVLEAAAPPLKELSLFSLDLSAVKEGVLRRAEMRVFVSHRHAAITPDS